MPTSTERPTRQRLLDVAADLLHRKGYSGTGLSEISTKAKTPKGSMYFHFPGGKEQLGAEALAVSGERFRVGIQAVVDAAPDGPQAARGLARMLAAGLSSTGYELGCPIATTTLEAASGSPLIREAANAAFTGWIESLRRRLVADGHDEARAEELATLVLSTLEGAMVLARARQSTLPLEIAADAMAAAVTLRP